MTLSRIRHRPSLWRILLLSAVLACGWTSLAIAQEAGGDSPAATTAEAEPESLLALFGKGGWAMYPLLLLSTIGVGLIIYNGLALRERPFLRSDALEELEPALKSLDIEKARSICADNPGAVTNIVGAGLRRVDPDVFDPTTIEKAMEEASSEELSSPFTFINYLATVGSVSPMIGLLGTVSGMVKAFNTIETEGMGKPELLAGNISEALITTASGLVVAIPAMIAYYVYKNRYGKLVSRVNRAVGDLYHTLVVSVRKAQ